MDTGRSGGQRAPCCAAGLPHLDTCADHDADDYAHTTTDRDTAWFSHTYADPNQP